jgi:hypothetical protein
MENTVYNSSFVVADVGEHLPSDGSLVYQAIPTQQTVF